jgi:serine/threonine-protein kinase
MPAGVPPPGEILAGKYRVDRVLGVGGMGVVVAAHHIQLDERVALKFLLPEALANPAALVRFEREARAAVKIKSEHVARVTDVGRLDNGAPYMVMEYLDGSDLSLWLSQRGPMGIEQAIDFVLQACEAIAEAHALGIVHRDLKPANLFCILRADGQLSIKVLDFGISKVTTPGAPGHEMTRTSALVGSPLYMSPEQMQSSKGVDVRTDIWSLAVIFFELVAGQVPFNADTVTELAIKIATEPAPPLRAFRSEVPYSLEQVIAKCLEKDRDRRYQTVGELAVALREFGSVRARASAERVLGTLRQAGGSGSSGQGQPPTNSPSYPAATAPSTDASWGHTTPGVNPRGKTMAIIASVIVLAAVAGIGSLLLRKEAPPAVQSAAMLPAATPPMPVVLSAIPSAAPAPSTVALSPLPSLAPTPFLANPPPRPGGQTPRVPNGTPSPSVAPAAPSAPPAPPKPNCDPPYYFDATGTRLFKKECL